jgi:crotonobetainyl-CoA:carnitine CoA-transferase CaiB-like acyl-CoA transferase
MATDNIFSGLKVVDLASFIAGPGAAVILSDFGADVIKVEPPTGDTWRIGYKIPPQPRAKDNYPWHLNNRNKRGLALDLKSPEATGVLRRLVEWADVLIVNTPHPAREKLKLGYEDVAQWNPRLIYADVTGYGDSGPDAHLPGFDITAYWARSGLLSLTRDAGAPPTLPVSGSGQPVFGDRYGALSARTHGQRLLRHHLAACRRRLGQCCLRSGRALRRDIFPVARPDQPTQRDIQRVSGGGRHMVRDRTDTR